MRDLSSTWGRTGEVPLTVTVYQKSWWRSWGGNWRRGKASWGRSAHESQARGPSHSSCLKRSLRHIMVAHDNSLSLSDSFHSVWWSLGPSMLLQMALFHSFLWLSSNCACIPHLLYPLSVDGHFVSMSWLLWAVLQCIFESMDLFQLCFFPPDICPGVGLLDHAVVLYLVFLKIFILFIFGCIGS